MSKEFNRFRNNTTVDGDFWFSTEPEFLRRLSKSRGIKSTNWLSMFNTILPVIALLRCERGMYDPQLGDSYSDLFFNRELEFSDTRVSKDRKEFSEVRDSCVALLSQLPAELATLEIYKFEEFSWDEETHGDLEDIFDKYPLLEDLHDSYSGSVHHEMGIYFTVKQWIDHKVRYMDKVLKHLNEVSAMSRDSLIARYSYTPEEIKHVFKLFHAQRGNSLKKVLLKVVDGLETVGHERAYFAVILTLLFDYSRGIKVNTHWDVALREMSGTLVVPGGFYWGSY